MRQNVICETKRVKMKRVETKRVKMKLVENNTSK